MPLRRRLDPLAVPAAERIVALLAGVGGGWVPPEEGQVAQREGEPVQDVDLAVTGEGPGDHAVAPRPTATRSAGGSHRLPGRLAAVLPVPLRTGRLVAARRAVAGLVLLGVLAAVATAGVVLRGRPQEVVVPLVVASGQPTATPTRPSVGGTAAAPGGEVVVAVAGEVVRPGLVRLPAGSRVADALDAAGGPTPGTEPGLLNLARRLVDGEQVLVGVEAAGGAVEPAGGGAGGPTAAGGAATPGGLVDLNTATAADLDALPGIGPVLAQRIVDWRTDNDRFGSVEQLREVTGSAIRPAQGNLVP